MNKPHLSSAAAAGVGPAVAVDGLQTAKQELHEGTYYDRLPKGVAVGAALIALPSRWNFPAFIFHLPICPVL